MTVKPIILKSQLPELDNQKTATPMPELGLSSSISTKASLGDLREQEEYLPNYYIQEEFDNVILNFVTFRE